MSLAPEDRMREAVRTIQALRRRVDELSAARNTPIAVIGMACRFPGADSPAALWDLLAQGRDAVGPIPADRWDAEAWHSADPDAPGRITFREGGFITDVDAFDAARFGIAAREAAGMDPQHRLLLELAWQALEAAALKPDALSGSATGVFLGLNAGDHLQAVMTDPARLGTHALAGAVASLAAGRIAYALGLNGPALVVDTACSSSLVATHLAVQALRARECDMALAGGAHLMLAPQVSIALSRARMMAPDGRCKAFDASADGFGQGEGGGMVVLKRLADAEAAGDPVLAVIRGAALNQDGRSAGITAPSLGAQQAVIRAALTDAGLAPADIDAIEAHGTGTALGDPVELHALAAVFGQGRTQPLRVGSLKTNIGHTAAAAGIAGLIKAVLMLDRGAVPASLHFRRLNPHVDLGAAPIEVPTALLAEAPKRVGVSGFGFSGTNAHLVLEAPPALPARRAPLLPVPLSRQVFPRLRAAAPETALFPGRVIDSPAAARQVEAVLDLALLPWLADHRVQGRIVVPGAVMIALLLAAAPPGTTALADIAFAEPVVLEAASVRLVALGEPDGALRVASRAGSGWLSHATARVAVPAAPLALAAPLTETTDTRATWIAHLAALGIDIGPTFQGIARIARGETTQATIEALPAIPGAPFHPALLDAVLQAAGGTLPAEPVLPIGIARLDLHAPLAGPLTVTARRQGEVIDLLATGDAPIASIHGLAIRRLAEAQAAPVLAALSWVPAPPPAPGPPATAIEDPSLGQALALVHRSLSPPAPLAFVTRGTGCQAQLHGLATALAAERPELRARAITVAPDAPPALLRAELEGDGAEPSVMLRAEGRFVPRLARIDPPGGQVALSGTVLITGGLGGIGRQAARWALDRGAQALLLIGRTAAEAPFPQARVLACDIAAPDATARIAQALSGMPPLHTIIHAAGVLDDAMIEDQTEARMQRVIAPKLVGAQALHALPQRPEHFLLFGSVASVIGAAGQAGYAAANAALDAFALQRRAQGLPAQSILWGRWAEVGMAAALDAARATRVSARGLLPMAPDRAMAALDAAILSQEPAVMIAAFDWARFAETAPPAFAPLLPATTMSDGPVRDQVADLIRQILGEVPPPGRALVACGLDSLMAMDLRNRINRRFGTALGLADLLGGADAETLAARIEAEAEETEVLTL
ncbi:SDR family NAD(P)-dependent oxidoreductase [Roseomonas stagni]|uniref:SDR family NAD(P)-dependent oxidoreductase n=1 Tax=Falsiroseomonas algicola TaxID=2716930 RepID=A0A6M1LID6_9PROT|nr:SDR family NAD(P)-dependent oxidoreductase [Falsiroseomonas algicola]NGM19912.1 SDR family NAD(P)-dependent oxidoreductase [Falsiroseomonas algicola]